MNRSIPSRWLLLLSLPLWIGGCGQNAGPGPSDIAKLSDGSAGAFPPDVAVRLVLTPDPAKGSDKQRLAAVLTNMTDHPVSYTVYERNMPYPLSLAIDESPDVQFVCISGGEPEHETVTLPPRESRTYHPLTTSAFGFLVKDNRPQFQPAGKTWHVRAKWGEKVTDEVAMKLD